MSVIVYHDGVMAADSRAYSGTKHPMGLKCKIHRLRDGSLLGVSSSVVGFPEAFRNWLETGRKKEDMIPEPSFDALLVRPGGGAFFYSNSYLPTGPLFGQPLTIGTGSKYALGAIHQGANAVRAVEVAIECDVWCGGPVHSFRLHEPNKDQPS